LTGSAVKAEPDGRGGWIVPKVVLTRETANEDLCLAVAYGCWVAEYCQRGLVIGF
jgi:hypothetical protein